jgi:spore maturation protein CgeB
MKKLTIFLVIGNAATGGVDSKIFIRNVYDTLINMGHNVTLVPFADLLKEYNPLIHIGQSKKEYLSSEILKSYRQNKKKVMYDVFLSFLAESVIIPEMFEELKGEIYTINYTTNYHQFEDLHKNIAPHISLNTYISLPHKKAYDLVGANSYWLPMAANPDFYNVQNQNLLYDASFVGSAYASRPNYIWRILQNDININVFGPGWLHNRISEKIIKDYIRYLRHPFLGCENKIRDIDRNSRKVIIKLLNQKYPDKIGGVLSDVDMVKVYAGSKIILNIQESRKNNDIVNHEVLYGANFRDFEVPMSGSMLLTQFSEELSLLYDEDKEIVTYKNEYEMIDKMKFYLKNNQQRKKIADAGHRRVLQEHTWEHRFNALFSYISL